MNTKQSLQRLNLSRQANMIDGRNAERLSMLIVGAGGIGSNAAYVAACMGVGKIVVYDDDVVQEENIAPQFYRRSQIDQPKVHALHDNIFDFTGIEIEPHNERFIEQGGRYDIVLVAVDSMKVRNKIWEENGTQWMWWLDGRMGNTTCSLLSVNRSPERIERYTKDYLTWEAPPQACGTKATAFITKGTLQGFIGESLFHIINETESNIPLFQIRDATAVFWSKLDN